MKFDFFKKKETETLDVPKNLPELAKDVIEPASADSALVQKKDSAIEEPVPQKKSDEYKIPAVPVSSGVPRLDLNLIRSENIHLPDMPQMQEQQPQQTPQEQFIENISSVTREPANIITPSRDILSENRSQRNIYINKGKALFDDLESAIASNRTDLAKNIINNILPLLYEYHDIDSMNDADRLRELKDLEKFWTMLQKRNYAVKSIIDSIESDILRKSNGLLSKNDASNAPMKIMSNQMSSASPSYSSAASSITASSSGYPPVFVPIIKNSTDNSNIIPNTIQNIIGPAISANPVYVQPHERFYFKDGKIASSLRDLYYVLIDISDDTFYHHVSIERNDFSNWIKDVLKDYSLAKEISTIYSRRDLIEFLKDKI